MMDSIFREYANPFSLLDVVIASGRFIEWIDQFLESHKEKIQWEHWLHKVFGQSWSDYVGETQVDQATMNMNRSQIETTIQDSYEIMNNFVPDDL